MPGWLEAAFPQGHIRRHPASRSWHTDVGATLSGSREWWWVLYGDQTWWDWWPESNSTSLASLSIEFSAGSITTFCVSWQGKNGKHRGFFLSPFQHEITTIPTLKLYQPSAIFSSGTQSCGLPSAVLASATSQWSMLFGVASEGHVQSSVRFRVEWK